MTSLLVLFALGFSSRQAQATVYYAATNGLHANSGLSWSSPRDLASALAGAHTGDQVWVKTGTYSGSFIGTDGVALYGGFAGTETSISQRNIAANPTILDGGTHRTPYTILSSATHANSIDGFTIQNGYTTGNGGGVLDSSTTDTLSIANCTFSSNSGGRGGGIYYSGTTLIITNATFSGNSTTQFGGGICCLGNAISLTISNSTFTNNTGASGGEVLGGGIYCSGTTFTISNSTFDGNAASASVNDGTGSGGAIYGGDGTISNSMFTNNTTKGGNSADGGAIGQGGHLTLDTCTFSNNGASSSGNVNGGAIAGDVLTLNHCTVSGNGTYGYNSDGGGIQCTSITATDSMFTGNSAVRSVAIGNAVGGGIDCSQGFSVSGSTFTSNSATDDSGAISGSGIATDCTFDSNSASGGGGIFSADTNTATTVSGCTFTNNTATAQGTSGYNSGGGIFAYGTVNILDNTFQGNSPNAIYGEYLGSSTVTSLIDDNLIIGSGTSASNPVDPDGIDIETYTSGQTSYLAIANNTITNTNVAINDDLSPII